jgi:excisionase family DNA binding protein
MGVGRMSVPPSDPVRTYRGADQRLRLLLLGDGMDTVGAVKGDERRQRVLVELRHMRNAFDASVLECERGRAAEAEASVADLEEELLKIASSASRERQVQTLLTPAEMAEAFNVSASSIYRWVRSGQLRAVQLTDKRRRPTLRIPASELDRLPRRTERR